ncbi:MAG: excisionase family DNA-binding protein [Verrucomicrobiae bacterium]|nr:excisionase family DNA-binding protein [Verrucomicrobiae bacterium]
MNLPVHTTEPWSSVEVVAKHLGVAKDSVYRWIETRSLPSHRIGRLWKFKLSEVDNWVRGGSADVRQNEPANREDR